MWQSHKTMRWKNPYIDLVKKAQKYVICGERTALSPGQIEEVRSAASSFAKVTCELCCGSGSHLIELAYKNPKTLHIGFELRFKRCFNAAKKGERLGLSNLLLIRSDAALLPTLFRDHSLESLYVNFPDPWSHHSWEKHRLLSPDFVKALSGVLRPGGVFYYKTDDLKYFESTLTLLKSDPLFRVRVECRDLYKSNLIVNNIPTEFEKLFVSKGLPILYLEAELRGQ